MYREKKICVVVPAHNEEVLIVRTIETMPAFVDRIVVVDDASTDRTAETVEGLQDPLSSSPVLIRHEKNRGVGAAIVTGYKYARDEEYDIAVVMAGDAQMDPNDLPALLDPVVEDRADYSKGNRLFTGEAWQKIPKVRYIGNAFLSLFTKMASGYWHVADSQTGYTAINLRMLQLINWDQTYKRYGCPNDYLVRLNIYNARVCDVPIEPVYDIGESSGIRLGHVIPRMSWLILRLFFWRMKEKYIIRDFHPLIFFYAMGLTLFPLGFLFGIYLFLYRILVGPVQATSALFAVFFAVFGLQSLFFAMWFDMESNKELKG